jgi:hypothetical protein
VATDPGARISTHEGEEMFALNDRQIEIFFTFEGRYQQFERPDTLLSHVMLERPALEDDEKPQPSGVSVTNNDRRHQLSFHFNIYLRLLSGSDERLSI